MESINNIITKLSINNYSDYITTNKYQYNGINVPRVTEILSAMIHEDFLMTWANSIGLYKRQKYKTVLEEAGNKGSYVHDAIDQYIKENKALDLDIVPDSFKNEVYNAFNSFIEWWKIIQKNNVKIIYNERELICPYFGGTLDLLIEINGKIYLLDFKTSNHPSYKYYLQLSAYRYILRNYENIDIDGCIILMLNKKNILFDEMILSFDNLDHMNFINYCEEAFLSLVYSYYNRLRVENTYKDIFGRR